MFIPDSHSTTFSFWGWAGAVEQTSDFIGGRGHGPLPYPSNRPWLGLCKRRCLRDGIGVRKQLGAFHLHSITCGAVQWWVSCDRPSRSLSMAGFCYTIAVDFLLGTNGCKSVRVGVTAL